MSSGCLDKGQGGAPDPGTTCPVGCMFVCPADPVHQLPAPAKKASKELQVQVLKVGVPVVWFKPFAPQGEAQGFEFPPDCG